MKRWIALLVLLLVAADFSFLEVDQGIQLGRFIRFRVGGGDVWVDTLNTPPVLCGGALCQNVLYLRNNDPGNVMSLSVQGQIEAGMGYNLGLPLVPAQITANQNDYFPTGCVGKQSWTLTSDAARDITGIDVASCFVNSTLTLYNIGSFNITLKDESASSLADNRFALRADFVLKPGYSLTLYWLGSPTRRWAPVGVDLNDPAGAPGSANVVEVEVDFGAAGATTASTVVTGQAWVTGTSQILCAPTMLATADRAEGAEDAVIEGLTVAAHTRVAATGFTATVGTTQGLAFGKYLIHCTGA